MNQPAEQPAKPALAAPPRWTRRSFAWAVVAIVAAIAGLHGRSINYGLFLDDHAHFRQLQEAGWSLADLTAACRLELAGGILDVWWLPDTTLRFFRPVSFALMKLTYLLTGWSPLAMHFASLLWHLASCLLLLRLLTVLGARPILATGVTVLFALHPGHVATVQWIASQSELMVTTFLLSGVLLYASAGGWHGPPGGRWRYWGALALFVLATGCRENAVMFPLVLAVTEWVRRTPLRRIAANLWPYFAWVLIYVLVRGWMLADATLPPKPYVIHPGDPDFFRFIFDKACYYLISQFPGLMLGGAWLLLFMLPVLPAFESPHHLYLPGIGWAVLGMLGFQASTGMRPMRESTFTLLRHSIAWTVGVFIGMVFGIASYFSGLSLDAAQTVEDRVVEEVAESPVPIHDGDTLYMLNLPTIAHYVRYGVEERLGVRNLKAVALTWSPRLLGNQTDCERRLVDPQHLEVRVMTDHYFAGPLGVLVAKANDKPRPVDFDHPVKRDDFTVELLAADDDGISAMRFSFAQPLDRPGVHVFWGSRTIWAYRIPTDRFDQ
ncbi:MAG: hypothetical protein HZB38_18965 [Planctomycetes bacterium]|nr:hypothetical protein [Planctomycetota bacterium]